MEFLATLLIAALLLATLSAFSTAPRHRRGPSVAQIQARLAAETARTYLPVHGRW